MLDPSFLNLLSPNFDNNSRRRRPTLRAHVNHETAKPLKDWMRSHLNDPYPNAQEVQELADATGFNTKQVRDWFTNNRRRYALKHPNQPLPWKKREAPKSSRTSL